MTSDTIDYFMSQPDGANYVVLYQMLCLKTINTDGRLSRQIGEVVIKYDIPKIQRDLKWFSADTIRVALNLYKSFGLVYEDVDGVLVLADHNNLVGSETDAASRMRNVRSRKADALPESVTQGEQTANIVTPEIENRDRDKEIRDKSLDKEADIENTEDSCAEPETVSAPPVISIILNDKTFFDVSPRITTAGANYTPLSTSCRNSGRCQAGALTIPSGARRNQESAGLSMLGFPRSRTRAGSIVIRVVAPAATCLPTSRRA